MAGSISLTAETIHPCPLPQRDTCLVRFNWIELKFVSPLVRIFWTGVNTAIAFRCRPNKRTETQLKRWSWSGSKWTLVRFNGWTNEWMTLAHVWFCLQFMVHLQKGQCESKSHQTNKKNNNIEFGPDQSKWTSGLSWCEYKTVASRPHKDNFCSKFCDWCRRLTASVSKYVSLISIMN